MSNEDGEMALVMHTCKVNMDTITWWHLHGGLSEHPPCWDISLYSPLYKDHNPKAAPASVPVIDTDSWAQQINE